MGVMISRWRVMTVASAMAWSALAVAAPPLRTVPAARCVPRVGDYAFMWWADGFPGRSRGGTWLRCVRTGRYGVVMDVASMRIVHFGAIGDAKTYGAAAGQDSRVFAGLPAAELELSVTVDGTEYRCVRGGKHTAHGGPRVIDSGRFVQRADVTDLVFEDKGGRRLAAEARLEAIAWPDRLTLVLEARPQGGRAAGTWREASMGISVGVAGKTVGDRVAGRPWRGGEVKRVAVSLTPGMTAAGGETSVRAVTIPSGRRLPVRYDATSGCHRVDLDTAERLGKHNDTIERVKLRLANPSAAEQPVRLMLGKTAHGLRGIGEVQAVTGISAMLRDVDGYPVGIPVQISKNWHRQRDRELVHQGTWLHGYTMLRLPAGSEVEVELTIVYAHWGGVAAASHAQLCLIGWGSNQSWDESAIGAWGESICYEPDQAQGQCAVLDVRPLMVHRMKTDRPTKWGWTNNVGGGDFFRYFDGEGRRQFPARMKTAYHRYCPNLTEVTYAGRSGDGKLEHRATVSIARTDDITRGIYQLRLDVKKPTAFSRMVFFQIGADTCSHTGERRMALGNESGLTRQWATQWGGGRYRTPPMECKGRAAWVSLHGAVSRDASGSGAWANRGVVIRRWEAMLGGKPAGAWAAEYGVRARGKETSLIDFVPPPGVKRLLPGDYVSATFEHVVMPQYAKDYYGPNANLLAALKKHENTWRMIHREAVGNDLAVQVSRGRLERVRPTRIRAAGDRAEFTITGGLGYVPITISNLSDYRVGVLEIREGDGAWRQVDQSVHGRDYWQADYIAATRTWELTYNIPLDSPGDGRRTRAMRFRMDRRCGENQ